ncbi:MAG: MFS transporter [Pirellulales bacterium]|nr:MFS transporter [Pirellulales bacterium]
MKQSQPTLRARHARRMFYANSGLWAMGNGLASTTLVYYLALELGAPRAGLGLAAILATHHLVGVLRLAAPALIDRVADRKRFCLGGFVLAAGLLLLLPVVAAPGNLPSATISLWVLVGLWSAYHLLQYLATVALWSWIADLVPAPIRGRFLGQRERWMVVGHAAAMLAAGGFTYAWHECHPQQPRWIAYAVAAVVGVGFMLAAVVPLGRAPERRAKDRQPQRSAVSWRAIVAPLADGRFRRLLLFGCWFSFSNGLTQSAHFAFPYEVLHITLFAMLAMQTMMRVGQFSISPWMGRLADRLGNRPLMLVCLLLTAQGPWFYFLATFGGWWWLIGAWAAWIAYAGVNVALGNLVLKLSPETNNVAHIAMYYAVTGVCCAASTLAGGVLQDAYGTAVFRLFDGLTLDYFAALFLVGWLLRLSSVVVLRLVVRED